MSDENEKLESIQELLAGVYIQQLRVYDVMMVLLAQQNPQKADELEKLHQAGTVLCPDPTLKIED